MDKWKKRQMCIKLQIQSSQSRASLRRSELHTHWNGRLLFSAKSWKSSGHVHRAPSPHIPGPRLSFKPCHSLSARLAAYHSAWFLCHVRKHHRCYIILPSIGRGTTIYLSDTIHPPVRTGVLWKSYNSSYNSTFNKILNIKKVVLLIVASQEIMCSCSRNHLSG